MKKYKKGFTLIELLMTIIIISVVAFIATAVMSFSIKDSRRKNKENEDAILKDAVEVHVSLNQMEYNGFINFDKLCMKDSITTNSECTNVTWCKILLADLVYSGAIDSFPSNVLNENGNKAYDEDNSFVYVQFINSNLVPDSITIDPDSLDTTCPTDLSTEPEVPEEPSTEPETPEVPEEPSTSTIEEKPSGYVQEGLIAWYDAEYNTAKGHDSETNAWKDLTGNYADIIIFNDVYEWGDKYLKVKAGSESFAGIDFKFPDGIDGFTISAVYSNDGYSVTANNYVWGFTTVSDSKLKRVLADGKAAMETLNYIYYKHPLPVCGSSNSISCTEYWLTTFDYKAEGLNSKNESKKISILFIFDKNDDNYLDITLYVNGTKIKTIEGTNLNNGNLESLIANISRLYLGGLPISTSEDTGIANVLGTISVTTKPYDTYLYEFMVYDKALKDEEITDNFERAKERFGITSEVKAA